MSHSALRTRVVKARPETQSPFAMLPLEIAADADLSPGAKVLFAVILTLTKGAWGRCCARNEKLAEMTGLSVIQTRRLLQDLEKRRLISRVMDHTRRVEIQVTWTPGKVHQNDAGGCITMMQGQGQIDAPDEISNEMTQDSASRPKKRKPRCFPIEQNNNPPAPPVPDDDPAATAAMWARGLDHLVHEARIAAEGGAS